MNDESARERMLFTFQSNGESHGQRLVEATAEHLLIHEAPVGPNTNKRSWFGTEADLPATLTKAGFTDLDIQGVLAGLRVNRVETREVEATSKDLEALGFAATADHRG